MTSTCVTTAAELGQAILHVRKSLGISQEVLSLQTGISRPTIRAIEQGKETVRIGMVLQLCQDLGIEISARHSGPGITE